jgi:hypothetical protein
MNDTRSIIIPGIEYAGPDGRLYETTGEYRPPTKGEWWLNNYSPHPSKHNWETPQIILRELPPPAKPRRVPTDADAIHRPQCWVRFSPENSWQGDSDDIYLLAVTSDRFIVSFNGDTHIYAFCEIVDVPFGRLLHWRDATEADIGTIPEGIQYANSTKGFGLTVRSISPGTRVLVEVGK